MRKNTDATTLEITEAQHGGREIAQGGAEAQQVSEHHGPVVGLPRRRVMMLWIDSVPSLRYQSQKTSASTTVHSSVVPA